jgi:hypothetical protein
MRVVGDNEVYIDGKKVSRSSIHPNMLGKEIEHVYSSCGTICDFANHFIDIRLK